MQKGSTAVKDSASKVQKGSEEIQNAIDPSLIPDGPIKDYVNGNAALANGSGEVASGASKLADGSVDLAKGSSKLANGSSKVAGGASDMADGSVELAEGSLALAAGSQLLSNSATQALFAASGALGASADSLADITGVNESMLGDYFYAPVKMDRHEIFPIPDYGSQVSPFYIVLSMWVGAIITCAMLRPGTSTGTKYTPLEMYFGKSVIFLVMGLLQACVTIIGSYILGIYIANDAMFILSCLTVSAVFMIFVYSLVSALGNVGKAVAIVLLVIQISGTGGIYPVEIMSPLFNMLNPSLPMTYAITLIREAQLGLIWSNFIPNLIILFALGIVIVIVSMIIKEKADKRTHYLENKLEDSGLF